ncbi:type III-A CRISPR-associated RAMP protein Csm3 [Membranicola marinus]|uniref:CRISPR system Cms endoribonuclease Csm3 n=1 Tax=Membranihabitans marinus TaxID=1227546 RepID=A0A953LAC1_9BACT|nr:type III-A CRISPR-associated RAMP protein Csm3 [Membranihabitans marinus]MBY5959775.1 type III-A CRISPR-associated RAMP protein Csm3 [Membranihabitans marinus]
MSDNKIREMKPIKFKTEITGKIHILSGIHIGGSGEANSIGGIDSPVIRTLRNGDLQPYLPGSSLRGKIRSLLEQTKGVELGGSTEINSLFGFSNDNTISKLIVYDSFLSSKSEEQLRLSEHLDMPYTEEKVENTIDRISGTSEGGLRHIERVPSGAEFELRMMLTCEDEEDLNTQIKLLKKGMSILEKDYLGGNGSRGYGRVSFQDLKYVKYDLSSEEYYKAIEENDLIITE